MFESWYFGLIIMAICSYVIAKSTDAFEVGTDYLGRKMSDGVKGVTLNAIGSSFPEFLTTIFFLVFATQNNLPRDLTASIGGNTGSAIFNSIIIPMLVIHVVLLAGATKFDISKKVILRDGLFLIAAELLLLVILSSDYITHWHGWILTGFYLSYLAYTLITMSKGEGKEAEDLFQDNSSSFSKWLLKSPYNRTRRSWVILLLSIIVIGIACAGLVESCKMVANSLNINPLFIALILVAAASSIPDTIISMKDARKGNHNDALSNVLGSNIFDITISLGLPIALFLLFTGQKVEFAVEGESIIDIRIMLLVLTIATVLVYYFSKNITRIHVFVFGLLYLLFVLYTVGSAQYLNGYDTWLAGISGSFIEFLHQPGGFGDMLQNLANLVSKSW